MKKPKLHALDWHSASKMHEDPGSNLRTHVQDVPRTEHSQCCPKPVVKSSYPQQYEPSSWNPQASSAARQILHSNSSQCLEGEKAKIERKQRVREGTWCAPKYSHPRASTAATRRVTSRCTQCKARQIADERATVEPTI